MLNIAKEDMVTTKHGLQLCAHRYLHDTASSQAHALHGAEADTARQEAGKQGIILTENWTALAKIIRRWL
jgi:hypothetical protein